MECREAEYLLPQYLSRSLSSAETVELMSHLSHCDACRKELKFIISVKSSVDLMTADVPEDLLKSAFKKVHEDNKPRQNVLLVMRETFGVVGDVLNTSRKVIRFACQVL